MCLPDGGAGGSMANSPLASQTAGGKKAGKGEQRRTPCNHARMLSCSAAFMGSAAKEAGIDAVIDWHGLSAFSVLAEC